MKRFKIGVFGSSEGKFDAIRKKALELGRELGENKVIVITGASTGIPYEVARKAKEYGAALWGYSPGTNLSAQEKLAPDCDNAIYTKLFYIPKDYVFEHLPVVCRKYRNVTSTATCDAGIIIAGRWGTLNEFTNLVDMGKVIGVLVGTGGIADELPRLVKKISKNNQAKIIFDRSPTSLVSKIIRELKKAK